MNRMHKTSIDLSPEKRTLVIGLLNETLAATTDLQLAIKHAHWNVKGMEFIALHKMFDEFAADILEQSDTVAERVTALGGTATGTLQQAVKGTFLKAYPAEIFAGKDHLKALAERYAHLAAVTREHIKATENIGDMGTSDLYIDLTRLLDKQLWFIEAHLQD